MVKGGYVPGRTHPTDRARGQTTAMPTAVAAARQSYADHPMVRLETAPPGPCHAVSLQETPSDPCSTSATVILGGVTVRSQVSNPGHSLCKPVVGGFTPAQHLLDEWTPAFPTDVYDYDVHVPSANARTAVLPNTNHLSPDITVATHPVPAPTDSVCGSVLVGLDDNTTATVTVTAEDGTIAQDYVARIHRGAPKTGTLPCHSSPHQPAPRATATASRSFSSSSPPTTRTTPSNL